MANAENNDVRIKLNELFDEILLHNGYGRIEVDMKILRKGQKEVILRCGKEFRFVVDFTGTKKVGCMQDVVNAP